MNAPLEIILSESASGGNRLLTLQLAQKDAERLSLPQEIFVLKALSTDAARAALEAKDRTYHVVIIEMEVPDAAALEPLSAFTRDFPNVPTIVLTNQSSFELVDEATRRGAQNYLVKKLMHEDSITRAILIAIDRQRQKRKLEKIVLKLRESMHE